MEQIKNAVKLLSKGRVRYQELSDGYLVGPDTYYPENAHRSDFWILPSENRVTVYVDQERNRSKSREVSPDSPPSIIAGEIETAMKDLDWMRYQVFKNFQE